jgi:hypothetical protein
MFCRAPSEMWLGELLVEQFQVVAPCPLVRGCASPPPRARAATAIEGEGVAEGHPRWGTRRRRGNAQRCSHPRRFRIKKTDSIYLHLPIDVH